MTSPPPRRKRTVPRPPARRSLLGSLFANTSLAHQVAAFEAYDKWRESHDPKWAARRAGLKKALEAKRKIARKEEDAEVTARINELEADVGRLALVVVTLTETIVRKGVATREELRTLVSEVDVLDGAADGKFDPAALRPAKAETPPTEPPTEPPSAAT